MQVSVVSTATPAYTARKFADGKVLPETYAFMEGKFFSGITVDRSIDRMPFRRIAEALAPELARQQLFPAKDLRSANLLVVMHWGTTIPYVDEAQSNRTSPTTDATGTTASGPNETTQLRAWDDNGSGAGFSDNGHRMFDIADRFPDTPTGADSNVVGDAFAAAGAFADRDMRARNNMQLLGYTSAMLRVVRSATSTAEEDSLRFDLTTERYFIILKAYDLREKVSPKHPRRALWTVHLNMRSQGINFESALASMSQTSPDFIGRTTDKVNLTTPRIRKGRVETAPLIYLGEAK